MTDGIAAYGAALECEGTPVAELSTMETPSLNTDYVEVTHHQSPGGFKEWVPTLRDGEEVAIEGNYVPGDTGQAILRGANLSGEKKSFKLTLPQNFGVWLFDAYVRNLRGAAPVDGKLGLRGTLKVSGEPVYESASSAS